MKLRTLKHCMKERSRQSRQIIDRKIDLCIFLGGDVASLC